MIDHIYIDVDENTHTLVLEDAFASHYFDVDPQMLWDALQPWREHMAEGEAIARERLAAGAPSWQEYAEELDDEFDVQRAHGDFLRKQARENSGR